MQEIDMHSGAMVVINNGVFELTGTKEEVSVNIRGRERAMNRRCDKCAFRDYESSDAPCSYCSYKHWCPVGCLGVRDEEELQ